MTSTVVVRSEIQVITDQLRQAKAQLHRADSSERIFAYPPHVSENNRRTVVKLFERATADTQTLIDFLEMLEK